jgi:hypothetical protein
MMGRPSVLFPAMMFPFRAITDTTGFRTTKSSPPPYLFKTKEKEEVSDGALYSDRYSLNTLLIGIGKGTYCQIAAIEKDSKIQNLQPQNFSKFCEKEKFKKYCKVWYITVQKIQINQYFLYMHRLFF